MHTPNPVRTELVEVLFFAVLAEEGQGSDKALLSLPKGSARTVGGDPCRPRNPEKRGDVVSRLST